MIYKIITKLHIFCLFRYGDFDMLLGDLFIFEARRSYLGRRKTRDCMLTFWFEAG